jgi:alpha-L-fucosidase 2
MRWKRLPKIRQLIKDGRPDEAEKLADEKFMGRPNRLKPYQMLADVFIDLDGHDANAEEYRRELDLDSAIARVTYRIGQQRFSREMFCSAAENVLAIRFTCEGGLMSGRVRLERAQEAETKADGEHTLVMTGTLDGGSGMSYRASLLAQQGDGRCAPTGNALRFENARELTSSSTAATNYRGRDPQADVTKRSPPQRVSHSISFAKRTCANIRSCTVASISSSTRKRPMSNRCRPISVSRR